MCFQLSSVTERVRVSVLERVSIEPALRRFFQLFVVLFCFDDVPRLRIDFCRCVSRDASLSRCSVMGSIVYTYITFREPGKTTRTESAKDGTPARGKPTSTMTV